MYHITRKNISEQPIPRLILVLLLNFEVKLQKGKKKGNYKTKKIKLTVDFSTAALMPGDNSETF